MHDVAHGRCKQLWSVRNGVPGGGQRDPDVHQQSVWVCVSAGIRRLRWEPNERMRSCAGEHGQPFPQLLGDLPYAGKRHSGVHGGDLWVHVHDGLGRLRWESHERV